MASTANNAKKLKDEVGGISGNVEQFAKSLKVLEQMGKVFLAMELGLAGVQVAFKLTDVVVALATGDMEKLATSTKEVKELMSSIPVVGRAFDIGNTIGNALFDPTKLDQYNSGLQKHEELNKEYMKKSIADTENFEKKKKLIALNIYFMNEGASGQLDKEYLIKNMEDKEDLQKKYLEKRKASIEVNNAAIAAEQERAKKTDLHGKIGYKDQVKDERKAQESLANAIKYKYSELEKLEKEHQANLNSIVNLNGIEKAGKKRILDKDFMDNVYKSTFDLGASIANDVIYASTNDVLGKTLNDIEVKHKNIIESLKETFKKTYGDDANIQENKEASDSLKMLANAKQVEITAAKEAFDDNQKLIAMQKQAVIANSLLQLYSSQNALGDRGAAIAANRLQIEEQYKNKMFALQQIIDSKDVNVTPQQKMDALIKGQYEAQQTKENQLQALKESFTTSMENNFSSLIAGNAKGEFNNNILGNLNQSEEKLRQLKAIASSDLSSQEQKDLANGQIAAIKDQIKQSKEDYKNGYGSKIGATFAPLQTDRYLTGVQQQYAQRMGDRINEQIEKNTKRSADLLDELVKKKFVEVESM